MTTKKKRYIRDGRAPLPKSEQVSKTMSAIKDRDTKPELALRHSLWANQIRGYRLHWKHAAGRPDICFVKRKTAIFVHGCFWHRCPFCQPPAPRTHAKFWGDKFKKNVERDKTKQKQLIEQGWKTLILWECQIKNDINSCIADIKKLLSS